MILIGNHNKWEDQIDNLKNSVDQIPDLDNKNGIKYLITNLLVQICRNNKIKLDHRITIKDLKEIKKVMTQKQNSDLVQINSLQINKTLTEEHLDHKKIILKMQQEIE